MWVKSINGDLVNLDHVVKIHRVHRSNCDRDDYIEAHMPSGLYVCIAADCEGAIDERMNELEKLLINS